MASPFYRAAVLFGLLICASDALAQMDYGNRLGRRVGDRSTYSASGLSIDIGALDPTVQRWYLPQELFTEYGLRQREYTNYARESYLRYIDRNQEGFYFYDSFGELITRGRLVYDWRQRQPLSFESSEVTKPGIYGSWFNRLVIASDQSGDYSYSIMIGDEINTTLTPMTFRKAGFNGVVISAANSNVEVTGLFSRISNPIISIDAEIPTRPASHFTNLMGGRVEAAVTNSLTLGATFVNAHNGTGARESFQDNPFKGLLTGGQIEQRQTLLVVRLSDDSPEDGAGGAVLFSEDVQITTTLMREVEGPMGMELVPRDTVITGSSIGFRAAREGGSVRDGFLTADGAESITLKYQLTGTEDDQESSLRLRLQQGLGLTLAEAEDAVTAIKNVRVRMVVANDYRIEVASDRQVNNVGQPQFIVVSRAPGNIRNRLNQREVVFDYGLPTANQIFGATAELRDFHGFDFYGEFNVNNQYRKYPSVNAKNRPAISGIVDDERAIGWMANLSKQAGPWHFFLEAFGMDEEYNSSVRPVNPRGTVDYSPEATNRNYDFVEDNDDNDRHPDQLRFNQGSLVPIPGQLFSVTPEGVADPAVFPGFDENGDFLSDFNQNSNGDRQNFFPDYDEPFLRYHVDRPEFLFGIDLNNNGWVDRFENDDEPDYPYKRDHWGHNAYGSVEVSPEIKLTLGRLDEEMRGADRHNTTTYGMFTFEKSLPTVGRVRVFNMLRQAEDTIHDHLSQWVLPRPRFGNPVETSGRNEPVVDLLAAEDTWINSLAADWQYSSPRNWGMRHRFKWDWWQQRNADVELLRDEAGEAVLDEAGEAIVLFDPLGPDGRNGRETSSFLGVINKADYLLNWGRLSLSPKVKSEFLREVPFSRSAAKQRSWDVLLFLQASFPLLQSTRIEVGLEQRNFSNLLGDEDEMEAGMLTGDFRGTVLALQLTNTRPYLGYNMTTQVGVRYDRRSLEVIEQDRESRTAGVAFISVFAGY